MSHLRPSVLSLLLSLVVRLSFLNCTFIMSAVLLFPTYTASLIWLEEGVLSLSFFPSFFCIRFLSASRHFRISAWSLGLGKGRGSTGMETKSAKKKKKSVIKADNSEYVKESLQKKESDRLELCSRLDDGQQFAYSNICVCTEANCGVSTYFVGRGCARENSAQRPV